jgi:hypothetical protein
MQSPAVQQPQVVARAQTQLPAEPILSVPEMEEPLLPEGAASDGCVTDDSPAPGAAAAETKRCGPSAAPVPDRSTGGFHTSISVHELFDSLVYGPAAAFWASGAPWFSRKS